MKTSYCIIRRWTRRDFHHYYIVITVHWYIFFPRVIYTRNIFTPKRHEVYLAITFRVNDVARGVPTAAYIAGVIFQRFPFFGIVGVVCLFKSTECKKKRKKHKQKKRVEKWTTVDAAGNYVYYYKKIVGRQMLWRGNEIPMYINKKNRYTVECIILLYGNGIARGICDRVNECRTFWTR